MVRLTTPLPRTSPASPQQLPLRQAAAGVPKPCELGTLDRSHRTSSRAGRRPPLPHSMPESRLWAGLLLLVPAAGNGCMQTQGGAHAHPLRCLRTSVKSYPTGREDRDQKHHLPQPLNFCSAVVLPYAGLQLLLEPRQRLPPEARPYLMAWSQHTLLGPSNCSKAPVVALSRSSPQLWSWRSPVRLTKSAPSAGCQRDRQCQRWLQACALVRSGPGLGEPLLPYRGVVRRIQ